jgi:hypothetical protein
VIILAVITITIQFADKDAPYDVLGALLAFS